MDGAGLSPSALGPPSISLFFRRRLSLSRWKTCDAHKTYGAMFVVTAVGGEGPPQHGVEMLDAQSGLKSFRKHNAACVWVSEMRFSTEAKDAPVV